MRIKYDICPTKQHNHKPVWEPRFEAGFLFTLSKILKAGIGSATVSFILSI